jgi:hypothetical protein
MPTTADIRRFIMDIFSDEELTTFCFDNFPEVQDNFTSGMTKGDKTLRLLDYCQRRERLPDLLKCLRAARPGQFDARLGASAAPQSSQPAGTAGPNQNAANISGGINLNAQDVSVGGDVAGRDKIMQAGGHIIIAGQGATVIVGKDLPEGEQPAKQDDEYVEGKNK